MSEYQKQKKEKPSLLDTAERNLSCESKEALLHFVTFLIENKMTPQWASTNSYSVSYRSRRVCLIKIEQNRYQLWLSTQYNDDFNNCFAQADESDKAYLLGSVTTCFGCGSCKPGLETRILGMPFQNACCNPVIRMTDPDAQRLALACKLVLLRRQAIKEGKAPRITYIAMAKR